MKMKQCDLFFLHKMSWIDLRVNPNYEIFDEFTYQIRKELNKETIQETDNGDGHFRMILWHDGERTMNYEHRLIVSQFIPNPENLPMIDHINRIPSDYKLDNLRWVSSPQNNQNKAYCRKIEYKYVNYLP